MDEYKSPRKLIGEGQERVEKGPRVGVIQGQTEERQGKGRVNEKRVEVV